MTFAAFCPSSFSYALLPRDSLVRRATRDGLQASYWLLAPISRPTTRLFYPMPSALLQRSRSARSCPTCPPFRPLTSPSFLSCLFHRLQPGHRCRRYRGCPISRTSRDAAPCLHSGVLSTASRLTVPVTLNGRCLMHARSRNYRRTRRSSGGRAKGRAEPALSSSVALSHLHSRSSLPVLFATGTAEEPMLSSRSCTGRRKISQSHPRSMSRSEAGPPAVCVFIGEEWQHPLA